MRAELIKAKSIFTGRQLLTGHLYKILYQQIWPYTIIMAPRLLWIRIMLPWALQDKITPPTHLQMLAPLIFMPMGAVYGTSSKKYQVPQQGDSLGLRLACFPTNLLLELRGPPRILIQAHQYIYMQGQEPHGPIQPLCSFITLK